MRISKELKNKPVKFKSYIISPYKGFYGVWFISEDWDLCEPFEVFTTQKQAFTYVKNKEE